MRKLFKGRNYSREETICGNTIFAASPYSVDSIKRTVLLKVLFSTVISKKNLLKILYIKKKKSVKS